ncbi:MAG: DUF4292 domain-containing protein [Flavobacteriales bacterium]
MLNRQILHFVTVAFIALFFVQCKAKKPLISDKEGKVNLTRSEADTIVGKVMQNNFQYENLKAKIKTKYKSREKQNLSFSTFLKMEKDSIIHATISFLTIPVVVAVITPDSLKFINKKDKKYFEGDFSYISRLLNTEVTFRQLQELLIGNSIEMDSTRRHILVQDNEEFFITEEKRMTDSRENWKVKYWINELFKAGKTILVNDKKATKIEIFQTDYNKEDDQLFPNRTKVEIVNPTDSISIQLNYQRVKINTEMEYEYSVPSHYEKYEK